MSATNPRDSCVFLPPHTVVCGGLRPEGRPPPAGEHREEGGPGRPADDEPAAHQAPVLRGQNLPEHSELDIGQIELKSQWTGGGRSFLRVWYVCCGRYEISKYLSFFFLFFQREECFPVIPPMEIPQELKHLTSPRLLQFPPTCLSNPLLWST